MAMIHNMRYTVGCYLLNMTKAGFLSQPNDKKVDRKKKKKI